MPTQTTAITLQVRGLVTSSVCRFTRHGVPVVELEIADRATGQTVCIRHHYPNAGTASAPLPAPLQPACAASWPTCRPSTPSSKPSAWSARPT